MCNFHFQQFLKKLLSFCNQILYHNSLWPCPPPHPDIRWSAHAHLFSLSRGHRFFKLCYFLFLFQWVSRTGIYKINKQDNSKHDIISLMKVKDGVLSTSIFRLGKITRLKSFNGIEHEKTVSKDLFEFEFWK